MRIEYKLENIGETKNVIITPCPFGERGHVGSVVCSKCKNFISKDERNQTVECKLEYKLKMKREILFRGKTKKGERLEGNLLQYNGKTYILPIEDEDLELSGLFGKIIAKNHEVLPDTVGQYTGLKDKNGNKIFEGDTLIFSNKAEWYKTKFRMATIKEDAKTTKEILEDHEKYPYEERKVKIPECYEWILSNEIQEYWEIKEDKNGTN